MMHLRNILDMDLNEDPDRLIVEGEVILLIAARQTDHVFPSLEAVFRPGTPGCKVITMAIISDISHL